LLLAAGLLIAGCRSVPLPESQPREDEAAHRSLVAELIPAASPQGTVQRWVVERRGVELFFTLYLEAGPPATLEAAILSDMGGTLAAMAMRGGEVEVLSSSRLLAPDLAERLLRDIAPLFLPGSEGAYRLVATDQGPALYRSGPLAALHRGPRVWIEGARGDAAAEVLVSEWRRDEGGRPVAPRRLSIQGHAGGYSAAVDVEPWEGGG
jgi:hypothetical protein